MSNGELQVFATNEMMATILEFLQRVVLGIAVEEPVRLLTKSVWINYVKVDAFEGVCSAEHGACRRDFDFKKSDTGKFFLDKDPTPSWL